MKVSVRHKDTNETVSFHVAGLADLCDSASARWGKGLLEEEDGTVISPAAQFQLRERVMYQWRPSAGVQEIYLTARQVIMRPVAAIAELVSPRRSSSKTGGANMRTYGNLRPWRDVDKMLNDLANMLDDTVRRFRPFVVPGDKDRTSLPAAADEGEVRGPFSVVSCIPNDVALAMDIHAELVGNGSGRSLSNTDWIVRKRQENPGVMQQGQPKQIDTDQILGTLEMKGGWQFDLAVGEDPVLLPDALKKALEPAFQQLFGDMVKDETPIGMIYKHNVCVLVKRSSSVKNKDLYVSRGIGLDRLLLACLLLIKQGNDWQHLKQKLSRDLVPDTPEEEPARGTRRKRDPGPPPPQAPPQPPQQGRQQRQPKRRKTEGQDQLGATMAASRPGSKEVPVALGSSGSSGSTHDHSSHGGIVQRASSPACAGQPRPEVCSFSSVGLTSRLLGDGCYGKVLEGNIGGRPAVIKLYDPRFRGAEKHFMQEWRVYEHMGGCQAQWAPLLLKVGMFPHTNEMFLAVTDEGEALPAEGPIEDTDREAMLAAVRNLHAVGVLHGDIRRANFVRGANGIKLVDFAMAKIVETPSRQSSVAMAAELEQVKAL